MTPYEAEQELKRMLFDAPFIDADAVDVPNGPTFTPPDGLWMRLNYSGAVGMAAGFGNKPKTHYSATMVLQVFYPAKKYRGELSEFTSKLAEYLSWLRAGRMETHAASINDVGISINGSGWYQINVSVPYLIKA